MKMDKQESFVLSDSIIIVKEEEKPILIADEDEYIDNNFCEGEPLQNFEEYVTGHENQVDPLGDVRGSRDDNLQVPRGTPGNTNSVTQELPLEQPPSPTVQKIGPSTCEKCNLDFPIPSFLELHMSTFHTDDDDLPHACSFCSKRFASLQHLKRHETIQHHGRLNGPPQFACDLCDNSYHLENSLERHRQISHFGHKPVKRRRKDPVIHHHSTKGTKNPNRSEQPTQVLRCPHCDISFQNNSLLRKHMVSHTKEKPFQCSTCQQPFTQKSSLQKHIRTVHENPTPTGKAHPPPRWQRGQPQTCNLCGKTFRMPWQLKLHMRIHTGEMPYECKDCGMRFRYNSTLKTHMIQHAPPDTTGMTTFKCRICGKEGFRKLGLFRDHRDKAHKHIPWKGEEERAFACGICGKPYYQRYRAITCAILGHDPSSLKKAMFKHKCPECPPESFGYHNQAYLRRHWEEEHPGKVLPGELRVRMYSDNLRLEEFPRVTIGRKEKEKIRKNGPPPVKTEFPLCVELELLPIPEEERFRKRKPTSGIQEKNRDSGSGKSTVREAPWCHICTMRFTRRADLRRHLKNMHGAGKLQTNMTEPTETAVVTSDDIGINGKVDCGVPPISSMFSCRFCERKFGKFGAARIHELRAHVRPWSWSRAGRYSQAESKTPTGSVPSSEAVELFGVRNTVNVNDEDAVRRLIGSRTVQIKLFRLEEDDDAFEWAFSNGVKIRQADVFLISRIC